MCSSDLQCLHGLMSEETRRVIAVVTAVVKNTVNSYSCLVLSDISAIFDAYILCSLEIVVLDEWWSKGTREHIHMTRPSVFMFQKSKKFHDDRERG